jgi:hypothetical protein
MRTLLQLALLPCGLAFAQTGPAGHWDGAIKVPDREVAISVDLAKDDKGTWIGSFAQKGQNIQNVPLDDVRIADKSVNFRIAAGGANAPSFACSLDGDAAMSCKVTVQGNSLDATLKRTGEAKVDLPKSSPAVSPELEGNWEGAIETPNGTLRIVVHFKNQPDKTVKGSMDSLDQGSMDLPLTDVVQNGSDVVFQLRLVNGSYKGVLNKEGTQIAGDWTQSGGTLPLLLKKSTPK